MKLVFVSFDFPNNRCGPAVSFSRLLPVLKARRHEVHALVFADHRDVPSGILQDAGVVCRFFPWSATTQEKVKWILRWLKAIKPDVFIPNSTVAGFYAARWARPAGIPTIGCFRSDDEFHARVVSRFVSGPAMWALSGLVCVSEKLASAARSAGAMATQIRVIPSGVPIPATCCNQDDEIRIAYSGRLQEEQKRIGETVEALIASIKAGLCSKAALFGDGPERGGIQSRIDSAGVGKRIILRGVISPSQIQQELREYNIIALLSDYEGIPGTLMDGMACGLVPVTTQMKGGIEELVVHQETGLMVRDRKDGFLSAIEHLKNDRLNRLRLSHNAKRCIVERYSLDAAASKWEEFFECLVRNRDYHKSIHVPLILQLPKPVPEFGREDFRDTVRGICRRWKGRLSNRVLTTVKSI